MTSRPAEESCPLPWEDEDTGPFVPPDAEVAKLFRGAKAIAVVGLSDNPARPSYDVAEYLAAVGYEIVPINPMLKEWHGRKAFPDLKSAKAAGKNVEFVDVFRKPEDVGGVVDDAVAVGARAIWFQLGVINEPAATKAQDAGMLVVMDRCSKIEHRRLLR